MSTTIRLDATALSKLIADDPDFHIELQRAVVAEVVKKIYLKDFREALNMMAPLLMKELIDAMKNDVGVRAELEERLKATVQSVRAGTYSHQAQRELPQETKQLIAKEVNDLVNAEVTKNAGHVSDLTERLFKSICDAVTERVEGKMSSWVDAEVERRITEGVKQRVGALVAGLQA